MSRRARLSIPGIPWHIIQRGNNRSVCFYAEEDYQFYLHYLEEFAAKFGCAVHAAATTTQLVPSANPARPGQAVSLSATVGGVNPAGTVTFRNSNTILGTALLAAGTAGITQIFNTVSTYTLTASYSLGCPKSW